MSELDFPRMNTLFKFKLDLFYLIGLFNHKQTERHNEICCQADARTLGNNLPPSRSRQRSSSLTDSQT